MNKIFLFYIIAFFTSLGSIAYAQTASIRVEVSGLKQDGGRIAIGLYDREDGFPNMGEEYQGARVEANGQTVVHTFQDIPHGTYAVAVIHDSNENGELDTSWGRPSEGFAFSNNVIGTFGTPPRFSDASFELDGHRTVVINMQYLQ